MEEKQVSLGGANNTSKIPVSRQTSLDDEFAMLTDVVELPSLGKLYPNQQKTVTIKYLTADDENILTNVELIRNEKVLDTLLENCIVSSELSTKDMLTGDRNKVLIDIRINGYGHEYEVSMIDPETGELFTEMVDLRKLKPKFLEVEPDNNGEFSVFLPNFKVNVKFRFLNGEDESFLSQKEKISKKKKKGLSSVSTALTDRYVRQIMEVNGNRDKIYITRFISAMPIKDSFVLREYISAIEPGIDLNYEFTSPSGNVFEAQVPMTVRLFWPNAKL